MLQNREDKMILKSRRHAATSMSPAAPLPLLARGFSVLCTLGLLALNACTTTQTVVVRFEDLKSDFAMMEFYLCEGEWQAPDSGASRSSNASGEVAAFHSFGGHDVRI